MNLKLFMLARTFWNPAHGLRTVTTESTDRKNPYSRTKTDFIYVCSQLPAITLFSMFQYSDTFLALSKSKASLPIALQIFLEFALSVRNHGPPTSSHSQVRSWESVLLLSILYFSKNFVAIFSSKSIWKWIGNQKSQGDFQYVLFQPEEQLMLAWKKIQNSSKRVNMSSDKPKDHYQRLSMFSLSWLLR